MKKLTRLKRISFPILKYLQVDRLFQYVNRKKMLILTYHGITKNQKELLPWTLIPVESFERHIKYICTRYNVVTLKEALQATTKGKKLPEKSAVITFDDGYRNNFTVAFPVLQKYKVTATIFLTAGYIGSKKLLPMDEAFLIIANSKKKSPVSISEIGLGPLYFDTQQDLLKSYLMTVAALKRYPTREQERYLFILKEILNGNYKGSDLLEDFQMLSWEEIRDMVKTGIIDIGAHTVSHEILSNVSHNEAVKEILDSKAIIHEKTGYEVRLFAYPNGTVADYNEHHIRCLRENGFICSVTTTPKLNNININTDLYKIGRISIGPELSSNIDHFALKVSGFISALKSMGDHNHV